MDENGKNSFWERLRATDEKTKRKIIIITSCICMIVIVYLWLGYFNNIISSTVQSGSGIQSSSPSFWDGVKNNANGLYKKITGGLGDIFRGSKQYIIQPQH